MASKANYLDFELQIWREGDRYIGEVKDSPKGKTGHVPLKWPFGTESHEALWVKLENAILKGRNSRGGGPMSNEESILHDFGKQVFRAVFRDSGDIALRFQSSLDEVQKRRPKVDGLRLKLRLDPPELASLPWEYMYDGDAKGSNPFQNYVCLRQLSPLVRFLDVRGSQGPLKVAGRVRILGMIANPGTDKWPKLDTEAERHGIEAVLNQPAIKDQIDFQWVTGHTIDDLTRTVQRRGPWHIFHFIGHGGTHEFTNMQDNQIRSEGFVVMQDGRGGAEEIGAFRLGAAFDGHASLRLAVLNCCESGRGSLSSAGSAMVDTGIPMAVSMQFPITNGSAACFAGKFYESLVAGDPVERSLTNARVSMRHESNVEWGIPVLFTRSGSCVLFDITPGPPEVKAVVAPIVGDVSQPKQSPVSLEAAQALAGLRELFKKPGK